MALNIDAQRLDNAVTRAGMDHNYRRRLIDSPRDALREVGIDLPPDVIIHFHEVSDKEHHLFLPPLPDLEQVRSVRRFAANTRLSLTTETVGRPRRHADIQPTERAEPSRFFIQAFEPRI